MKFLNGFLSLLVFLAFSCGHKTVSDRDAASKARISETESADELAIRNGSTGFGSSVTMIEVTRPTCNNGVMGEVKSFCSAAVVDDQTLLTAAHCLARLCPDRPVRLTGIETPAIVSSLQNKIDRAEKDREMLVATGVFLFEGFTGVTKAVNGQIHSSVDLALIKFGSRFKSSNHSKFAVAPNAYKTTDDLNIWGYGLNPGEQSFKLSKGDVLFSNAFPTLAGDSEAASGFRSLMVRARDGKNSEMACSGDSGGPITSGGRVVVGIMSASYSASTSDNPTVRCSMVSSNTYTEVTQGDVDNAVVELAKTSSALPEIESAVTVELGDEFDGLTSAVKTFANPLLSRWDTFSNYYGFGGVNAWRNAADQAPSNKTSLWPELAVLASGYYKIQASYKPETANTKCAQYEIFDRSNPSVKTIGTLNQTLGNPLTGSIFVMMPIARLERVYLTKGKVYSVKLTGRCDGISGKYMQADAIRIDQVP